MAKKTSYYSDILHLLAELKKEYPNHNLAQHLSVALVDYRDIWAVPDKEVLFALEKYRVEMENNVVSDEEVEKIVKDAENLDKLFQEEEDYD